MSKLLTTCLPILIEGLEEIASLLVTVCTIPALNAYGMIFTKVVWGFFTTICSTSWKMKVS